MYSTKNKTTRQACEDLGFIFSVRFVRTMKRNGRILVSYTAGKPEEVAALRYACECSGGKYAWVG